MINVMRVEIQKIIVSDAFACGKNKETDAKCFIGYETGNKIIPLFIEVPQMIEYFNKYKKIDDLFNQGQRITNYWKNINQIRIR